MWIKTEREVLPQREAGVDYSTKRDVLIRRGTVCVCKTRGHTGWCGIGCTEYMSPQWFLRVGPEHDRKSDLNDGYGGGSRVTNEQWASWLPKIAKAMGLRVDQMPQKLPRGGTLVWDEGDG